MFESCRAHHLNHSGLLFEPAADVQPWMPSGIWYRDQCRSCELLRLPRSNSEFLKRLKTMGTQHTGFPVPISIQAGWPR